MNYTDEKPGRAKRQKRFATRYRDKRKRTLRRRDTEDHDAHSAMMAREYMRFADDGGPHVDTEA